MLLHHPLCFSVFFRDTLLIANIKVRALLRAMVKHRCLYSLCQEGQQQAALCSSPLPCLFLTPKSSQPLISLPLCLCVCLCVCIACLCSLCYCLSHNVLVFLAMCCLSASTSAGLVKMIVCVCVFVHEYAYTSGACRLSVSSKDTPSLGSRWLTGYPPMPGVRSL